MQTQAKSRQTGDFAEAVNFVINLRFTLARNFRLKIPPERKAAKTLDAIVHGVKAVPYAIERFFLPLKTLFILLKKTVGKPAIADFKICYG